MKFLRGQLGHLLNQLGAEGNSATGSPAGTPPPGDASGQGGGNAGQPPAGASPPPGGAGAGAPQAGNGQGGRVFTQEEVNRIAAQARDEGRRSVEKAAGGQEQGKAGQKPDGGEQGQQAGQTPDVTSIVQQAVAQALQAAGVDPFTQAARAAGYSDAQIQLARVAHEKASPADLGAWLAEWPTQVGMTIKPQQGAAAAGSTAIASQGAAPRKVEDMRDEAGLIDVFSLAPEQVMAMGPARIRQEYEKVLEAHRQRSGAPPLPAALRRSK